MPAAGTAANEGGEEEEGERGERAKAPAVVKHDKSERKRVKSNVKSNEMPNDNVSER